ncbi:hypothetical protein [Sediminibacillus halophilus]|uniref:hypothetical protein n=1 Tax=Sediminibacillus halophilus TaxID=482461 RepID=UPI00094289C0|nr:hypothetical protein [Sediminibacillus halophilus]
MFSAWIYKQRLAIASRFIMFALLYVLFFLIAYPSMKTIEQFVVANNRCPEGLYYYERENSNDIIA